jgi:hypothetical protein
MLMMLELCILPHQKDSLNPLLPLKTNSSDWKWKRQGERKRERETNRQKEKKSKKVKVVSLYPLLSLKTNSRCTNSQIYKQTDVQTDRCMNRQMYERADV